jgi:hypothetical protein
MAPLRLLVGLTSLMTLLAAGSASAAPIFLNCVNSIGIERIFAIDPAGSWQIWLGSPYNKWTHNACDPGYQNNKCEFEADHFRYLSVIRDITEDTYIDRRTAAFSYKNVIDGETHLESGKCAPTSDPGANLPHAQF